MAALWTSDSHDPFDPLIPATQVPIPPVLGQCLDLIFPVEFVEDAEVVMSLQ